MCLCRGSLPGSSPWPEGVFVCVCTGLCCYILQSSSRTMVTTNAFLLTTHALLLSANHGGETPPSRPMVQLPCLHAPRRQGPWLSIQGSGARETEGGERREKEGETGEGQRGHYELKGFTDALEHRASWAQVNRKDTDRLKHIRITSRSWIHVMDTLLSPHACFLSLGEKLQIKKPSCISSTLPLVPCAYICGEILMALIGPLLSTSSLRWSQEVAPVFRTSYQNSI